jgi:hypothetical protein
VPSESPWAARAGVLGRARIAVSGGILGWILAVVVAIILVGIWSRMVGPGRTTAVERM